MAKGKSRLLLGRSKSITSEKRTPKGLKPQKARQLIRRFHVLQKQRAVLIRKIAPEMLNGDSEADIEALFKGQHFEELKTYRMHRTEFKKAPIEPTAVSGLHSIFGQLGDIDGEIASLGGIEAYQAASTQGQDSLRGGDSSRKLVEWLKTKYTAQIGGPKRLTALEIGCLSANNAISTSKIFLEVVRLDLNSQNHSKILQQDFMLRPLPRNDTERFNLVSCSLVINFVPSPEQRGEMLKRITKFLKGPENGQMSSLFLVLPLPCVSNSRYFDRASLNSIMSGLGFTETCYYEAKKIAYWLFDYTGDTNGHFTVTKLEKHPGVKRNNFCITIG